LTNAHEAPTSDRSAALLVRCAAFLLPSGSSHKSLREIADPKPQGSAPAGESVYTQHRVMPRTLTRSRARDSAPQSVLSGPHPESQASVTRNCAGSHGRLVEVEGCEVARASHPLWHGHPARALLRRALVHDRPVLSAVEGNSPAAGAGGSRDSGRDARGTRESGPC
jgi:hypothetical protein